MSRLYKGHVKKTLIFSKCVACKAVSTGIIGRLGKIFSVGLNFFGCRKWHSEQETAMSF